MLSMYQNMSKPQINLYNSKYSKRCQAVILTAKELNINLNVTDVDLTKGEHLTEEFLKINPMHTIPTINDNGFVLFESRAIMKYLCDRQSIDSSLYPKDPKTRALIDQILDFDNVFYGNMKEAIVAPLFGVPKNEEKIALMKERLRSLDKMIGKNMYLVGNGLTIADISVLATTQSIIRFGVDLSDCPNFKRWIVEMMAELPYFQEVCSIDMPEIMGFVKRMKAFQENRTNNAMIKV